MISAKGFMLLGMRDEFLTNCNGNDQDESRQRLQARRYSSRTVVIAVYLLCVGVGAPSVVASADLPDKKSGPLRSRRSLQKGEDNGD